MENNETLTDKNLWYYYEMRWNYVSIAEQVPIAEGEK